MTQKTFPLLPWNALYQNDSILSKWYKVYNSDGIATYEECPDIPKIQERTTFQ